MVKRPPAAKRKRVNLALQGGGAHGAQIDDKGEAETARGHDQRQLHLLL